MTHPVVEDVGRRPTVAARAHNMGLSHVGLLAVLVLATALGFASLTRGHDWGGDFAQYIMQAQAIVDGDIQEFIDRNTFTIEGSNRTLGPVAYPWGYPLAIAPVVLWVGSDPFALKLVGLGSFLLFLIAAYMLFEPRIGRRDATLLAAVLAAWPALLALNNQIMSDMPFAALSSFALVLLDRAYFRGKDDPSPTVLAGLGVVIFTAVFVRTIGILLLATLIVVQLSRGRRILGARGVPRALIPTAVFFGLYAAAALVFPTAGSYMDQLIWPGAAVVLGNMMFYLNLGPSLLDWPSVGHVLFGLCVPFGVVGVVHGFRQDYHFLVYTALTLGLLVVLPFQGGERYIVPLVPLFAYYAFAGMKVSAFALRDVRTTLGKLLTYGFWCFLFVAFTAGSAASARRNLDVDRRPGGPYSRASAELFAFVKRETHGDAVIGFFKPRVMRLMTDRDARYPRITEDGCVIDYYVHYEFAPANYAEVQISAEVIAEALRAGAIVEVWRNKSFRVYRLGSCARDVGQP